MNSTEGWNGWERTRCLMSGPAGSAVTPLYRLGLRQKGGDTGDQEFQGGTAQEGLMLFRKGMNKSWVRK